MTPRAFFILGICLAPPLSRFSITQLNEFASAAPSTVLAAAAQAEVDRTSFAAPTSLRASSSSSDITPSVVGDPLLLREFLGSHVDRELQNADPVTPILALDAGLPEEGCSNPAGMLWTASKKDQPLTGKVADNVIDGDGSTWFAISGRSRWLDVGFAGGEGGDSLVEGVAIGAFCGDFRSTPLI